MGMVRSNSLGYRINSFHCHMLLFGIKDKGRSCHCGGIEIVGILKKIDGTQQGATGGLGSLAAKPGHCVK